MTNHQSLPDETFPLNESPAALAPHSRRRITADSPSVDNTPRSSTTAELPTRKTPWRANHATHLFLGKTSRRYATSSVGDSSPESSSRFVGAASNLLPFETFLKRVHRRSIPPAWRETMAADHRPSDRVRLVDISSDHSTSGYFVHFSRRRLNDVSTWSIPLPVGVVRVQRVHSRGVVLVTIRS